MPKGVKDSPGLSQEQMLWGVLALLCTAVVCFAAGILVNKIQTRAQVATTETKETGQVERLPGTIEPVTRKLPKADTPEQTSGAPAAEGVQVSPAPVVIPDASKETAPPSKPVTQRDTNSQFVPAPPPKRDESTAMKPDEAEPGPVK
ncbi:MAG: hypothetical protein FJY92_11270, partial [Candidatus Hydrogenedentes bacterium]|nr:hypothetical protein [Candidatus Hydrogenedentota bacterium]